MKTIRTVTICNKAYKMPVPEFREITRLESLGYSLFSMIQKRQVMFNTICMACVSLIMDVDYDEALDIVEQHIADGGDIVAPATAFLEALAESEYFTKAFGQELDVHAKEPKAKKKTTTEVTQN